MLMRNTKDAFYGQQDGEKILYHIEAHPIHLWLTLAKLYAGSLAIVLGVLGTLAIKTMEHNSTAYITDRRVVRFHAHSPFATSSRTLSWDQAVTVKTFPPNFIYKILMTGSVIIHSKSTIANSDTLKTKNIVSNDDLELTSVYYYKDLGNYIDKIIYLYNREPEKLNKIRPFTPKPKGKRY